MIISVKNGIKLIGISIVSFCAVFVCTFFLNYYKDVTAVAPPTDLGVKALYDAQVATAKITCAVTGGVLGVIALCMLVFYIKLFIDAESKRLGMLKALGYSNAALASRFWVFGLSVSVGAVLGYACGWAFMPLVYDEMTVSGMMAVPIRFHAEFLVLLVIVPPVLFGALSCAYAAVALRKSPTELLRGSKKSKGKAKLGAKVSDKPFLSEMRTATLRGKKSVVFFVAFACFCFSAMVQMGASMTDFGGVIMSMMILVIGVVLAVTTLIMAVTTAVNANKRNIAVMKAFGYSKKERAAAVLAGYIPFAVLGFAIGTVYQYGFLCIMINLVFSGVGDVPAYGFDVPVFFITLGAFIVCYLGAMMFYAHRIGDVSIRYAMSEE